MGSIVYFVCVHSWTQTGSSCNNNRSFSNALPLPRRARVHLQPGRCLDADFRSVRSMREEFFFEPGDDPRHDHNGAQQDTAEYQQGPWPLGWNLNNWKCFGFVMVAEDLSGSLDGGGDSALHASKIDSVLYIVPSQIEVLDLRFWAWPV